MNDRKRKNIIIMTLCGFMVLMGVGYALLSQTLTINSSANINSTWDIRITNVEVESKVGYATDTSDEDNIADDGHSATITADLSAPGDSITYTVTVHNFGTIAGMYDVNTQNLIVPGEGQPEGIVTAKTDVATSNTLKYLAPETGEGTFNVTLKFEDIDELPDVKEYSFTIAPNFIQTSESGVTPGGDEDTDHYIEPEFTVLSDGTLVKYNYDKYYDASKGVSIPASFDNNNIYSVTETFTMNYNFIMDDSMNVIIFADTNSLFNEIKDAILSDKLGEYFVNSNFYYPNEYEFTADMFNAYMIGYYDENSSFDLETNSGHLNHIKGNFKLDKASNLINIGANAFSGCGLSIITIPKSVMSVGAGAFGYNPLTTINIEQRNTSIQFPENENWYDLSSNPTFNYNYVIPNN